ncbi:MAG TPA: DUF1684 domain-containing protein [Woeseiaceae bacterium]|nr:DUF1684 domain-containing protein [Woeseiaceae bacterium]
MKLNRLFLLAPVILSCFAASTTLHAESDPAYQHSIEDWRAERLADLKGPDGYLNLVGLFWLQPGATSFGAAHDNDLVFPGAGLARLGEFRLGDEGVSMTVASNAGVTVAGRPVISVLMPDDTEDDAITAQHGSLAWNVVRREDRYAIRLRDYSSPALAALTAIPHYDVDSRWRVDAVWSPYAEPRVVAVGTVIAGLGWNPVSPGVVEFEIGGEIHSLEAYESGDSLFFVFGDQTSGRGTYPAGRFLYADLPQPGSTTVLDFNRAYNPPCAFNDFSTCPVAAPRNRLKVAVTAGEKYGQSLQLPESAAAH